MNRGNSILNRLFSNSVHSIRRLAANDSEAKAMYRFLQNDHVSEEDIIRNMSSNCVGSVGNRPVLCIQDTSDVNLYNHKNRIRMDGYIGTTNAKVCGLGFHIHPGFVIDAESFMPYGFSAIKIWNRSHEQAKKDVSYHKKMLPIEGKESYRWIESSLKSKEALQAAREIIIIQDREGDIYEQFAIVPDAKTHLLIRAKTNRVIQGKQKLFDYPSSQPLQGSYQVKIEGDKRRNTQKRNATIEVRFSAVTINSHQYIDKRHPEKISLYAIEAKEVGEDIANPIHWRLLTTKKVEDLPTALLA